MFELLWFLLGGGACTGALLVWQRTTRNKNARLDEQKYKHLWTEAVELLSFNGQLTDDQFAKIMPKTPKPVATSKLPTGQGFSSDRRNVEIARAKQGLPPADNLRGMFSSDVRKVQEARIRYGTAQ